MRRALVLMVLVVGCRCQDKPVEPPKTVPELISVDGGVLIDDASRMNQTRVAAVVRPRTREALVAAIKRARGPVSFAGARHSQGGHTFVEDGLVLDLRGFNRIHEIDRAKMTVRVDAGVTWDQLQVALNPLNLAVRTQQSSNIFTLGGSMSSNIHGRDPRATLLHRDVLGFRLLTPEGRVVNVKPGDPRFGSVLGGYGLFGLILDVDLQVTENVVLEKRAILMDYQAFPAFFDETLSKPEVALFIARPSVAPSSLLRETAVTWWTKTALPLDDELKKLQHEKNVARDKLVFDASRASDQGKEARWALQKKLIARPGYVQRVSRNNSMRPPTAPLKLLEHFSEADADIVQEYFVPVAKFTGFVDGAREILERRKVNLLGLTIRFVEADEVTALPYATEPSFSFMLYTNQNRDERGRAAARAMTHELVELALAEGGRHYLTYQTWPSREQVVRGYPGLDAFCERKRSADPAERFTNGFYKAYCGTVTP